ncbi:MAG: hypothetical protein ACRDY0_04960 [Acidimicrobiales bacterium]
MTASGFGCAAGAPVALTVDDTAVGHTTAAGDGTFEAPIQTSALAVGRHQVQASCGPVLDATFDVVLASQVSQDGSTVVIIVFVVLLGLVLFRRRLQGGPG